MNTWPRTCLKQLAEEIVRAATACAEAFPTNGEMMYCPECWMSSAGETDTAAILFRIEGNKPTTFRCNRCREAFDFKGNTTMRYEPSEVLVWKNIGDVINDAVIDKMPPKLILRAIKCHVETLERQIANADAENVTIGGYVCWPELGEALRQLASDKAPCLENTQVPR
jgi:hypothetical protein